MADQNPRQPKDMKVTSFYLYHYLTNFNLSTNNLPNYLSILSIQLSTYLSI